MEGVRRNWPALGQGVLFVVAGAFAATLVPVFHMWAMARGMTAWADGACGVLGGIAAWYALQTHTLRRRSRRLLDDAGAQRESAEALRREEVALRSMTNAIPGALVECYLGLDGRTRTTFLNDGVQGLFGHSLSEIQADAWLAWSQVPREDRDAMVAASHASAAAMTPWVQEFRVVRGDHVRWVRGQAIPEREADGGTVWHGILTDVTAAKRLEQALRDREETTRRLYEIANAVSLGFDGRVREMLGVLRRRFGSDVAAVSRARGDGMAIVYVDSSEPGFEEGQFYPGGQTFCHSIVEAGRPMSCAHVGASEWRTHPAYASTGMESFIGVPVAVNRSTSVCVCLLAKTPRAASVDGVDRELLQQVAMWVGAELERAAAAAELQAVQQALEGSVQARTSELLQANVSLQLSEERLRHALAVGRMGIWERDLRTGVIMWDERLREILGVPVEGAVDFDRWWLDRLRSTDRVEMIEKAAVSERGGPDHIHECRYQRPDGRWVWLSVSGGARIGIGGTPTHLAGTAADITARKDAEADLKGLTADLDRRVVERTRDLDESRARLRALVAELTRTEERERRRLATELHDSLTQTLILSGMNVARAARLVGDAGGPMAAVDLLGQTQSTLDAAIAYTRTLIGELSPRVLYDFGLAEALQWLADQMKVNGLHVTVLGGGEALPLRDEQAVLLFHAARELLWNVVKHAEAASAEVRLSLDETELRLVVEDAGAGFDDGRPVQGGGFGLLSIRERLAMHGGHVEVRSERGRGSRVTLRLPLTDAGGRRAPGVPREAGTTWPVPGALRAS